ncbi:DUF58 domain-containing protein [Paenibacillus yanchengensis]|uniref:DUF58 domain-containing protein n=1 Tax=Paenibacillus yanchengensis TaxID=2035833 RepID=A0ABW4YKW6_9BACL
MQQKQRFWLACTLYCISLMYLLFQGGKTALMLFTILNLLFVYLLLSRWSGIAKVTGRHYIKNVIDQDKKQQDFTILAGTTLHVELQITIPGFYPIPYVIVDDYLIRHDGHQFVFRNALLPSWKREGQVQYTTLALKRGAYLFEQTTCTTKDVFGLFAHSGKFYTNQKLYVQPRMIEITKWEKLVKSSAGVYAASSSTRYAKETTQINGVRQYVHGDRLSRIHWNATARTGQLKSKEFEKEALPKLCIVLDCCHASDNDLHDFELAVSVAASLINSGLRFSSAVGLITASEKSTTFPTSTSPAARQMMLRHLTTIECSSTVTLMQALQSVSSAIDGQSIVLLVSANEKTQLLPALQWLERKELFPQLFSTYPSLHTDPPATLSRQMGNRWPVYDIYNLAQLRRVMERGGAG